MARLFGTDGVRGVANKELTCETAFKLGQAAVAFQGKTILIGKDTRLSGDMLESAVASGIMSMGGTALLAGIIPTPAIALLVRELHCDGGIVISASHNPPEYNGIKLFDGQGFKLPDAVEDEIEAYLAADDACELYIAHAVSTVAGEGIDFAGLKVALDAGHGASCMTSAEALRRLGAEVVSINEDFDGTDINVQCGSTHLEPLRALVAETGADVGMTATPTASCLWTRTATRSTATWWRPCALSTCTSAGCLPAAPPCPPSCATSGSRMLCAMRASSSSRRRWATVTCWRPCARAASSWAASSAAI